MTYRGHFHEWVPTITHREVAMKNDPVQYVSHFQFVPGYTGLNDHARKATQSQSYVTWGMILVEIVGGELAGIHPIASIHDTRVREEITL